MVLVMEDDIVTRNPAAVIGLLDFLYANSAWDVCFGGVSACRPERWARLTGLTPTPATAFKNITSTVMEIPVSLSTVMIAYNHTSYDTVLSIDHSDPSIRLDMFLSEKFTHKWVHVPFLAEQRPGYSDIHRCETNSQAGYRSSEQFLTGLKQLSRRNCLI